MTFFPFRTCNEPQAWFQQFSTKVNSKAIEGAVKILKRIFNKCEENEAWIPANEMLYEECTMEIMSSDPQIAAANSSIEAFSKDLNNSPNDIWYIFEKEDPHLQENVFYGLETALKFIKEGTTNQSASQPCQGECLETVRDVTVILMMIKWGFYGPAEMAGGHYLASHRKEIGNYFSNSLNNQWPYSPLHMEPTELEVRLNKILTDLTETMYDGKIKGVSILDLPAFGSKKIHLDDNRANFANWENELNFFFLNRSFGNMTKAFKEYKEMKAMPGRNT